MDGNQRKSSISCHLHPYSQHINQGLYIMLVFESLESTEYHKTMRDLQRWLSVKHQLLWKLYGNNCTMFISYITPHYTSIK